MTPAVVVSYTTSYRPSNLLTSVDVPPTSSPITGVFFSSSFAAIFWFRSRGMLPGLCASNELIARDEGMHTSFACLLWHHLEHRAPWEVVKCMLVEAVKLEQDFFEGE